MASILIRCFESTADPIAALEVWRFKNHVGFWSHDKGGAQNQSDEWPEVVEPLALASGHPSGLHS